MHVCWGTCEPGVACVVRVHEADISRALIHQAPHRPTPPRPRLTRMHPCTHALPALVRLPHSPPPPSSPTHTQLPASPPHLEAPVRTQTAVVPHLDEAVHVITPRNINLLRGQLRGGRRRGGAGGGVEDMLFLAHCSRVCDVNTSAGTSFGQTCAAHTGTALLLRLRAML